jgi:CBS domain-containing protein
MKTGDICNRKVIVARGDVDLAQAAKLMKDHHVGSLVVVEGKDPSRPVGIITDRDIVVKVVADEVEARTVTVGEVVAGRELALAFDDESSADTLARMRHAGVRRMPVVDASGRLVGIVALDDFISCESHALGDVAETIANERLRERVHTP